MHYVEEVHQLVGAATTCWHKDGTFNESEALNIASRLCDMIREREEALYFAVGALPKRNEPTERRRRRKTKE